MPQNCDPVDLRAATSRGHCCEEWRIYIARYLGSRLEQFGGSNVRSRQAKLVPAHRFCRRGSRDCRAFYWNDAVACCSAILWRGIPTLCVSLPILSVLSVLLSLLRLRLPLLLGLAIRDYGGLWLG